MPIMSGLPLFMAATAAILATPGPTNALLATSAALVGIRRSLPPMSAEIAGYFVTIGILLGVSSPLIAASPAWPMRTTPSIQAALFARAALARSCHERTLRGAWRRTDGPLTEFLNLIAWPSERAAVQVESWILGVSSYPQARLGSVRDPRVDRPPQARPPRRRSRQQT